jgi:phage shock protein PspC (stress-responsive transcriptional regulator)
MTSAPPPAPPPAAPPPPLPPADDPGAWPPPPPAGPALRSQLRRSRGDKVIGGVAGGLAEYSGIDALLWRVGFVALTLAGGTGIIVYLLLWLLMPVGPWVGPGAAVEQRVRPPAGPRSPVPGITIAAVLIIEGLLALLNRVFDWDLGPTAFFGTALLTVGLGLVAAAFTRGRTARGGLIALGAVLSVATIAASTEPWPGGENGIGDQIYREVDAEMVQPVYECGVGDCTLDLSDVDVSDLDGLITTRLSAGVGDVEVIVPRSADVRVSVDSGIGSVRMFGEEDRNGGYFEGLGTGAWTGDRAAEIDLSINAGIGSVEVSRG